MILVWFTLEGKQKDIYEVNLEKSYVSVIVRMDFRSLSFGLRRGPRDLYQHPVPP